ncbi:hypothetical protein ACTXT7_012301 [Hymenolepis weldensis]
MVYDKLLIYFFLIGFTAGAVIKSSEVSKCDCTAQVVPPICYYFCYQHQPNLPASTSAPQNEQVLPVHDSFPQQQARQSQPNPQPSVHILQNDYSQAPQHSCFGCCPQQNYPGGNCPYPDCGGNCPWQPQECPNCPHNPLPPPGWRGQNCPNGICPQLPQCPQFFHRQKIEISVFNETSNCEPYGCGYYFGESYGYSWSTLYAPFPGFEDYERIQSPIKREILVSMPNIGYCFGNNLFFANPSFARYIIARHWDPAGLLSQMDEPVLYKMLAINPGLDEKIASFTAEQIAAIFERIYNNCHFLHKFSKKTRNIIMLKVRHLQSCRQTTTTATPTTAEPVTPLYKEKEIVAIETKIPKFRKLLKVIPLEKANELKKRTKENFATLFLRLPGEVIEKFNKFLDFVSDPKTHSPKFIVDRTIGSSKDLFSILVRQMLMSLVELFYLDDITLEVKRIMRDQ